MIWLLNWLLFRNTFGAGLIKMRGDACWRELTCLDSHYETQPLPNPLSWHAHHLPDRVHRLETLGNHVVEFAVPFLYVAPEPYAAVGGLQEYTFKGPPVRPNERPSQWAPYHLRLDWHLWFAAMRPRPTRRQRWLLALLADLLEGDAPTVGLLGHVPFPSDPPDKVRVLRYRYRYTSPDERGDTGDWWRRERVGQYVPPVSIDERRQGMAPPRGRFL